jgi:HSP20 family molecular chaperone IbpA
VLRKSYLVRARQPASTMGLRSAGSLRTRPSGAAQGRRGRPNKTSELGAPKGLKRRGYCTRPVAGPYNIERLDENNFQISVALAGFKPDEVELTVEQNVLTLEGRKSEKEGKTFLHRGISARNFKR